MTKTFADIIDGIRKAVLGVEVREDIAQGMEYVEQFATTATQKAKEAASSAERASQAKQETENAKDTAVSEINTAKSEATAEIETARKNAADNIDSEKSSALTAIGEAKETGLNALDEKQQAALDSVAEAVSTAQSAAGTATTQATTATRQATAAASSASAAKTSESNAKTSETESAKNLQGTKEYFEQVRTITIGAQGWYATPEALKAAVPVGENGWWAVVGTTDTIWTWDSDTGKWVNTQAKVDLSDFYTQAQVNALLSGYMPLRAATTTVLGGIKVGDNLSIDADGKLNGVEGGYSKDEIDSKLKRLESMIDSDGQLVYSTMVTVKAKTDNSFITETVTTNTSIPDDVSYISIFMVSTSTEGSLERCRLARGGSASFSFKDISTSGAYNADANFVGSTLTVTTYKVSGKANAKFNVFGYKYL